MEKIQVAKCTPEYWQKYSTNDALSVFQHPDWLKSIISKQKRPIYLEFTIDNKVVAIASGLEIKNSIIGYYLYFYSAIIPINNNQQDAQILRNCYASLKSFARENNYFRIIVGSYDSSILFSDFPSGYHPFTRTEFLLNPTTHDAGNDYGGQIKKNLKKARKVAPSFSRSYEYAHLNSLLKLLEETYNRRVAKKTEKYNPLYLQNISIDSLKKLLKSKGAEIYITETENTFHSMCYSVVFNNRVYLLLMGNSEFAIKNGISTYMYDCLIQTYKQKGIVSLNFGGTTSGKGGEGLTRFKKSIGCEAKELYGATTNFTTYPLAVLNPILNLIRKLPKINWFSALLEKTHN